MSGAEMNDEVDLNALCISEANAVDDENSAPVPELPVPDAPIADTPMLKLDADCLEELFEWLPLTDLLVLRQTCKRLQQVVDYFIKSSLPAVKIGYGKIRIGNDFDRLKQYDPIKIKMIKELIIYAEVLTWKKIDMLAPILPQIEFLQIHSYGIQGDFYKSILKRCTNLKYLSIPKIQSNVLMGNDNCWLLRQYPSLEHIELKICPRPFVGPIDELKTFFELNKNVRVFSTTITFLCRYRNFFLESNVRIDRLDVYYDFNTHMNERAVDEVCDLLNKLYVKGFYERVHMCCQEIRLQRQMDQIASVSGMDMLELSLGFTFTSALPAMDNLRKLIFHNDRINARDLETIAKSQNYLERVYFVQAKTSTISVFLRHAQRLKELKVVYIRNDDNLENKIIDLVALNDERSNLDHATKVTIYVEERVFLATKFAKPETELSLVTLKRATAVEWTHNFRY